MFESLEKRECMSATLEYQVAQPPPPTTTVVYNKSPEQQAKLRAILGLATGGQTTAVDPSRTPSGR